MTVTVDPNFIYGMLREYNSAAVAKNIGGTTLSDAYVAFLNGSTVVRKGGLGNCFIETVTGGAKISCIVYDYSDMAYTTNGAAYRFERKIDTTTYTYELFKVSFSSMTKGSGDTLTISAYAVLKVG